MGRRSRKRTALAVELGRRLAKLRELKEWSIAELARRADVDPSLQGRIERGEVALTADRLALYAAIFDLKVGELFEELPADASPPPTEAAS